MKSLTQEQNKAIQQLLGALDTQLDFTMRDARKLIPDNDLRMTTNSAVLSDFQRDQQARREQFESSMNKLINKFSDLMTELYGEQSQDDPATEAEELAANLEALNERAYNDRY